MIHEVAAMLADLRFLFWKTVLGFSGGQLGEGTRLYEGVKMYSGSKASLRIGKKCVLQKGAVLAASEEGRLILGDNVYVGEYTVLSSRGRMEIGEDTIIATHVFIVDFDHAFEDSSRKIADQGYKIGKVIIGRDVWIGAGCKILKGVTIGDGCVIGAGSVVTKDMPPYTVCAGVPARALRKRGN